MLVQLLLGYFSYKIPMQNFHLTIFLGRLTRHSLFMCVLVCASVVSPASAQVLLTQNFEFTGPLTINGWTAFSGTGVNPMQAAAPGLTYPNLPSSGVGNAVTVNTSGEDAYQLLTTANTAGSIYTSFTANISSARTGDYFYALYDTNASGGGYYGRIFARTNASGYSFGISRNTSTSGQMTYETNVRAFNTTYLVVAKMERIPGLSNDVVSLWVDPVLGNATEPAALITNNVGADNTNGINAVALRQGSSNSMPLVRAGSILVGTSWSQVTPSSNATNIPSIASFTPLSGAAGTLVTISGTNFLGATSVAFNGTTSIFSVDSDVQISATVPVGATAGPVSVTTPGGVATSTGSFAAPTVAVVLPASINEGADATGELRVNVEATEDITVELTSSSTNDLTVETPVTIFQGTTNSFFNISAPLDSTIDSNTNVTVTPSVAGFGGAPGTITVLNVDRPFASLPSGGYTQNFLGFTNQASLPLGWLLVGPVTTYLGDWGAGTSAGSLGNSSVFGYQHTGSSGTLQQILNLKNETGSEITALTISYTGEVARAGEGRTPSYAVTVGGIAVPALSYSTAGGVNEAKSTGVTGLSIPVNGTFQIVWTSERGAGSGSSRQIGIGEFAVTIGAIPQPPAVASVTLNPFALTQDQAEVSSAVIDEGSSALTACGFVYSQNLLNTNPVIGGLNTTAITNGSLSVSGFTNTISGLLATTAYTVRSFAINSQGTNYSSGTTFDTLAPNPTFGGAYTQSFNGQTNTLFPVGWRCLSTSNVNSYAGNWNASNSVSAGFYGRTNVPGVLGYLHTSSTGILSNTLTLVNNTGGTLTNLFVSYMGEVNLTNNTRFPAWTVVVNGETNASLAYSTGAGSNEFKSAEITGLNITNGGNIVVSWWSDRGSNNTGSSRLIGMTDVRVSTTPFSFPEIGVTGSLTSFATTTGSPSAAQSFSASGANLTGNITVTAPTDYEVSLDNSAFSSSLTLPQVSGTVASTPVYVRIAATAPVGNPAGQVTLTSTGATSQNIAVTGTVASATSGFTTWAQGAPTNSTTVGLYAIGGATSPTATDGVPSQTALTSNNLSIIAIVRTNDPNLTVFGQATANLKNVPWTTNGVTKTNAPDQLSVPSGTARQIFSIERGTNTSLFLRIDSILQP